MNTAKTKINTPKSIDKKKKEAIKKWVAIWIFIGWAFTYFEIRLFEATFISFWYPFVGWLLAGLIATWGMNIYISHHSADLSKIPVILLMPAEIDKGNFFWSLCWVYLPLNALRFIYCTMAFGGIFIYCAMALNFYGAHKPPIKVHAKVIDIGKLGRSKGSDCRQPYAEVEYKGQTKQLIFGCGVYLDNAREIDIQVEKGLFGFDVVQEQKPVY